jgi:hypothetical protein
VTCATLPAAAAVEGDPHRGRRRIRRAWARPLPVHLAILALVLLALVPLIGTGGSFSADEGAAILEARSLSRGDGWVVEHPVPEVDPTGAAYPLELSERGPRGTAPFAKHPLYALLLAGADRVGGVTAMVALSLLGTVAAAGLAALLAGRLDPALARPAVWAVGLGSPLLFDGFLVIAHTLGAAAAAAAVLAAAAAFERRKPALAVAVVPCVAVAVLLRSEAVFLGLGLAVAAGLVGLRRGHRAVAAAVASGALLAAAGAHLGEAAWIRHILGGAGTGTGATLVPATSGLVSGRVDAFVLTWLRPSYQATPLADLALLTMVAAVTTAALVVRRLPARRRSIVALAGLASAAAVLALLVAPRNLVPGLLVACPLVAVGLVLADRRALAPTPALLGAVTAGVFALGVLATQYPTGGSGEWGGRYFALALPVALPVLLLAIRGHGSPARFVAAALVVCSLAMAAMAVGGIRSTHRFATGLVSAVDRAAGPGRPVLVTTAPLAPRLAWPTFDRQRWLLSSPAGVGALVDRLRAAGVERFTFVARGGADVARLPAGVTTEASTTFHGWRILVLRTAGPA